jgi:hypothetical protein
VSTAIKTRDGASCTQNIMESHIIIKEFCLSTYTIDHCGNNKASSPLQSLLAADVVVAVVAVVVVAVVAVVAVLWILAKS